MALRIGQDQSSRLRLIVAASFLAGLLLSHRLWLSERVYPLTPVVSWLRPIPFPWDWALYAALLAAIAAAGVAPRPRIAIVCFAVAAAVLAAFDQSRWQPWAYQYAIMLLAVYAADPQTPLAVGRLAVGCTYLWSGLQKLNPDFATGTYRWLIEPLTAHLPAVAQRAADAMGHAAPFVETAIGVALLTGKLRRVGVIGAIGMHLFIMLAIGPLGRSANEVVWPWNLAMMACVLLLFWNGGSLRGQGPLYWLAVAAFAVLPALSFFGLWDSYLSMSLYSGNQDRGTIYLTEDVAGRLPDAIADQLDEEDEPGWDSIDINLWSFGELHAPAYPEVRILRNAARVVCGYDEKPGEVRLEISPKRLLVGQRPKAVLGCEQLRK